MKYRMMLDYDIATGDLTPYFDALAEGRALASTCTSCGHVAFPARTTCTRCAGQEINWTELTGTAQVLFRTDGPTDSFALVHFDGADTNSTVALSNPEAFEPDVKSLHGRLVSPPDEQPGLWLALTTNNQENDDER